MAENMSTDMRHGILLADISARSVNYRQAVGIWVLAKSDVRARGSHLRTDFGQILCGRFGRVSELSVRLFAQNRDLTAKLLQQASP